MEDALSAKRYDQVLRLVQGRVSHPQLRMYQARALAVQHGPERAYAALGLPQSQLSFAMAEAWLADWPPAEHGPVASFVGDLAQLLGRRDALIWWSLAIDAGGPQVNRDRLLLAVAEEASRQQRWDLVRSSAQTLWSRRADPMLRLRAGELLGLALLQTERERAFDHYIVLLAQRDLAAAQQARIVTHMAQAWWRERPAFILRLCRQALTQAELSPLQTQELQVWQALTLAQLDPAAGLQSLRLLPQPQRSSALIQGEIARLERVQDEDGGIPERRKRAQAALALGDVARAERILLTLYADDGESLALWLELPERDLLGLTGLPSAATLAGGFPSCSALPQRANVRRRGWC